MTRGIIKHYVKERLDQKLKEGGVGKKRDAEKERGNRRGGGGGLDTLDRGGRKNNKYLKMKYILKESTEHWSESDNSESDSQVIYIHIHISIFNIHE